jgi:CubicO group peptidase (beta-lactamase class C family)
VLGLVDEGRLSLDARLDTLLPRPLPDYGDVRGSANWGALAGDERWRRLTPRLLLSHRSGFANFGFLEPDGRLRFHFEPGARYGYSGDGYQLLQFALEQGLGLNVGAEMQRRVFDRLGMARTAMTWRADFADDLADGWTIDGTPEPHARRSRVRAAGSMDTTITDFARFAAAVARGDGLSPAMQTAWWAPQAPLTTATQFPTLQPELPAAQRRAGRHTGLGTILFDGPQGRGQYKGGHDERTGNTWVTLQRGGRGVVLLSNDVRAEPAYPGLVRAVLGDTGTPWDWEYGPQATGA